MCMYFLLTYYTNILKQVTNSESTNYPPDRVKNLQATIDTDENLIKIEFIATGSDLDDGKGKFDSAHWG